MFRSPNACKGCWARLKAGAQSASLTVVAMTLGLEPLLLLPKVQISRKLEGEWEAELGLKYSHLPYGMLVSQGMFCPITPYKHHLL